MNAKQPITDYDLHAYVDAELDPVRRMEVEEYLKHNPAAELQVRDYTRQREELRALYTQEAGESVPPELDLTGIINRHRAPQRWIGWQSVAAAVMLFGFGSAGGWMAHSLSATQPAGIAAVAQEASFNYAVYSPDQQHPVQITASDSTDLVDWISSRLRTPVAVPDLTSSGYGFMGGSLVATADGPAGMFMYGDGRGTRIVMFIRPLDADADTNTMLQSENGSVTGFSWVHGGIGYSVVGAVPSDLLLPIASGIRRQVARGG